MSSAGLRGVVAGNSGICTVDGEQGRLTYRGYEIGELATRSTFEEVAYLLWQGELPNADELNALKKDLGQEAALPAEVLTLLRGFPADARPMDALRSAVSLLGMWDPEGDNRSEAANRRRAVRLTAQMPTLVATLDHLRNGREPMAPRADLPVAANFLYMLHGKEPSATAARTFDVALILHADHEFNASTFSARVTIATLADLYSAITSALGTLSGPLHGGANEAVFRMLTEIGDIENAAPYVKRVLGEKGGRVMGFGHAVYRTMDPRATALKGMARSLTEEQGRSQLFELSERLEALMLEEKRIYPNVDFYSASVYNALGIPTDLFTPIFAISRITGWTAHVLEQLADNRIIRPRAEYIGPAERPYMPLNQR